MMQDITLNMLAGQPGVIKITSVTGYGDDVTLAGAVKIRGESVTFEATSDTLTIPALPPGVWRYAVLINGSTAWRGSLMVEDSPLFEDGGQTVWAGTVSKSDDVLEVTISFGVQGPAGPQGADGASAYDIWLAAGNSGTEEEFLESLVGPQGDPGTQGETGPAPAHEWQGTSLRFAKPDGTWGEAVDLQGPQGEAGTGSDVTIDSTPTSGSGNAVSSGGVYDALKMPGSGTNSTAVGASATAENYSTSLGASAAASGIYSTAVGSDASAENHSTSLGASAAASGVYSTAVGRFASARGDYATAAGVSAVASGGVNSTSLGAYAVASGDYATAAGVSAVASGAYATAAGFDTYASADGSSVFGAGGYIGDSGGTVINAGGPTTNGLSTQLYLIPAESDMANIYTNGEAGLGFVVLDHLSGIVAARGTIPLASICTDHSSDFSPTNVTSIRNY